MSKTRRYPQMTQISADENTKRYVQRVSKSSECYSDGGLPRMREGERVSKMRVDNGKWKTQSVMFNGSLNPPSGYKK